MARMRFEVAAAWAMGLALPLLETAWVILCGGFYSSFFSQIRFAATPDISGYSNALVIAVKGCLYAVAIAALVKAIQATRYPT